LKGPRFAGALAISTRRSGAIPAALAFLSFLCVGGGDAAYELGEGQRITGPMQFVGGSSGILDLVSGPKKITCHLYSSHNVER
jgi:hypothetical protein